MVPPKQVYLLNDRRGDGEDSRAWGPVNRADIEARIQWVWLSLDWYDSDGSVRGWPRLRWSRLLRSID